MATSEIDGAHGIPIYTISLDNELQQVLHGVVKRSIIKENKPSSSEGYSHRATKRGNKEEEKSEGQKRKTNKGMIKFQA